jgi:hypothetical protein
MHSTTLSTVAGAVCTVRSTLSQTVLGLAGAACGWLHETAMMNPNTGMMAIL